MKKAEHYLKFLLLRNFTSGHMVAVISFIELKKGFSEVRELFKGNFSFFFSGQTEHMIYFIFQKLAYYKLSLNQNNVNSHLENRSVS